MPRFLIPRGEQAEVSRTNRCRVPGVRRHAGEQVTNIRQAMPDDASALAELRWEFRAGREAPVEEHGAFVARCGRWMRAALVDRRWRVGRRRRGPDQPP